MTIKQTCIKILQSKEWKESSEEDQVKILIQLCFLVFDQTRINMVRRWGKVKFFTTVHQRHELNSIEPPEISFDIR